MPADAARGQLPSRNGQLPPPIFDAEFSEAPRHLRDYLSVLHRHRGLAIACFGVTVGLMILVTLLTPRLYTASTRLQVARQSPIQLRLDGNVLRLADGDRDTNAALTFVSAQVAALQRRDLAERVIREHGLATNEAFLHPRPRLRGLLALGEALPRLVRPRGLESAPAGYSERETASRAPAGPALIDRYMRYLKVEEIRGTDIVEVRFTTPDPALSALLTAAHTQAYLDSNEEARRGNDVTAQEFLGRQLEEARKQVEGAEAALSRFAVERPSVAVNEEQKTVGQRITDLSSQLTKAERARVALQTRYEFLTRKAPGDLLASFLDRPGIQKLHLALLDLRAERAGLDGRLGPNHPQSQELRRQQAEIEEQLRAEVTQEVEAVRSRYDAARLAEEELRRKLDRLGAKAIERRERSGEERERHDGRTRRPERPGAPARAVVAGRRGVPQPPNGRPLHRTRRPAQGGRRDQRRRGGGQDGGEPQPRYGARRGRLAGASARGRPAPPEVPSDARGRCRPGAGERSRGAGGAGERDSLARGAPTLLHPGGGGAPESRRAHELRADARDRREPAVPIRLRDHRYAARAAGDGCGGAREGGRRGRACREGARHSERAGPRGPRSAVDA